MHLDMIFGDYKIDVTKVEFSMTLVLLVLFEGVEGFQTEFAKYDLRYSAQSLRSLVYYDYEYILIWLRI